MLFTTSLALASVALQERVQLARYCHLPVGNMTGDWILNTADALFARCLRDADHLLWASDPSLPDVAGPAAAQQDTARFLLDRPTMEVCPAQTLFRESSPFSVWVVPGKTKAFRV